MNRYVVLAKDDRNPARIKDEWIEVEADGLSEAIDKGTAVFLASHPSEAVQDFSFGVGD